MSWGFTDTQNKICITAIKCVDEKENLNNNLKINKIEKNKLKK